MKVLHEHVFLDNSASLNLTSLIISFVRQNLSSFPCEESVQKTVIAASEQVHWKLVQPPDKWTSHNCQQQQR